jgi:S-DNA-T family DNA segregation ATPase FtsK/SpoIIIE
MPSADTMRLWAEQRLGELVTKLKVFGLPVQPVASDGVEVGPTFARLKVVPLGKTGVNQVRNKAQDLQIHLNVPEPPIIGPQPGCIGVDVALPSRRDVPLAALPPAPAEFAADDPIFPVGLDVTGRPHWLNLADSGSCHLLVAGTTGSGKSVFLQAMLAALAHRLSPEQLQLVLIDPKRVTFNFSGNSPYLRAPVVATAEEALPLVEACMVEMERRYSVLHAQHKDNVSQLKGGDILPRTVLVFDEFADLMDDKSTRQELERMLRRMAAKARAAGVHLVLATQRPEAKVVTPLVRSNIPGRVALKVASEADSKIIVNEPDAFRLLGRGDLLLAQGGGLTRLQSPRVRPDELAAALRVVC